MPIYVYKGKEYVLENTTDPKEAKEKILKYLGSQEKDTKVPSQEEMTFGEALKGGWADVGKRLATGGAFLGSLVTPESMDDKLFASMEEAHKQLDAWANPSKKQRDFGDNLTAVVGSLPGQLLALPFSPAETGQIAIDKGETVEDAQKAAFVDTVGNMVGVAVPAATVGKVGKQILTGSAAGAGQDYATRDLITQQLKTQEGKAAFEPTLETTALAGIIGGALGPVLGPRAEKPFESQIFSPEVKRPEAEEEITNKNIQKNEADIAEAERRIQKDLEAIDNIRAKSVEEAQAQKEKILKDVEFQSQVIKNAEANLSLLKGEEGTTIKNNRDQAVKETSQNAPDSTIPPRRNLPPTEESIAAPRASEGPTIRFRGFEDDPELVTFTQGLIKDLGLQNDRLDTNLKGDSSRVPDEQGSLSAFSDRMELALYPENIKAELDSLKQTPLYSKFFQSLDEEGQYNLAKRFVVAHELGHAAMVKLLQSSGGTSKLTTFAKQYETWRANNPDKQAVRQASEVLPIGRHEYQASFADFFANRVAKELLFPGSKSFFKHLGQQLKKIYDNVVQYAGINQKDFPLDSFIRDIIQRNKQMFEDHGKTIWEMQQIKENEKGIKHLNYSQAFEKAIQKGWDSGPHHFKMMKSDGDFYDFSGYQKVPFVEDQIQVIEKASMYLDITPYSSNIILNYMRDFGRGFVKHGFGILQKQGIWNQNPIISHVANVILEANQKQIARASELLSGAPDRYLWDKTVGKTFSTLQRLKDENSVTQVLNKTDGNALFNVFEVLKAGYNKFDYEENLKVNGQHLTDGEVKVYNTLTKMFRRLHSMSREVETELGKKNIIGYKQGWLPAIRHGKFSVSIHKHGIKNLAGKENDSVLASNTVYLQHFFTRREAENFAASFKSNEYFAGNVREQEFDVNRESLKDFAESFTKFVEESLTDQGISPQKTTEHINNLLNTYLERGGVLGHHQKFRSDIPGYRGSELFKTSAEAGESFRKAIFSSVEEYTRLMAKMELTHKTDVVLSDPNLLKTHPNAMDMGRFMQNYALNNIEPILKFDGLKNLIDSIYIDTHAYNPMKFLGAKKYPDVHVADRINGEFSRFFYVFTLMSRPSFWAAQGLQFTWAARSIAQLGGGPLAASIAFGRAVKNFTSLADRDFIHGMFHVSQNTHTFHPQFINDLNSFHVAEFAKEGKKGKLILEILTGEKPSTMADSFSRVMTYSWMYEFYKSKGFKGKELWEKAAKATDENMVQYGRQYKAPIFQEMGMLGDMMAPLQTFPQAALGNLVADINVMLNARGGKEKLKASMPFFATMAVTTLMTGAIGAPLVAEYEALRLLINSLSKAVGSEVELPSIVDWALGGDNTFANRALSHGLPGAATMQATGGEGIDFMSSNRWQPLFNGILEGEKTFIDLLPVVGWTADMVVAGSSVALNTAGIKEIPEDEVRKQALTLTPGAYKALTDLKFDSATRNFVPNTRGDATVPETTMTRATRALGSRTVEQHTDQQKNFRFKAPEKKREEQIQKKKNLLYDAYKEKNQEEVTKLALELYEMGVNKDTLVTFLESKEFNKNVPEKTRLFVDKSGNMSDTNALKYQRYKEQFGENE